MDRNMDAVVVANGAYGLACEVETAVQAIYDLWERHFSAADAGEISAYDAKNIGTALLLIHGCLFYALRDFKLSVGEDGAGVEAAVALVHEYERIKAAEHKAGGAAEQC